MVPKMLEGDALRAELSAFSDLMDVVRYEQGRSPWARTLGLAQWLGELRLELHEAEEAMASGDPRRVADELSDVLGDAIKAVICAERLGVCDVRTVLGLARAKLIRRKPWLADGSSPPETITDEGVMWEAAKAKARERDGDGT